MRRLWSRGWFGAIAVFGVALAARLTGLGTKPLWLDEVFTLTRSSRPIAGVIADSLRNHHIPSFFLLEHALIGFGWGRGTWISRIVPATAGAVAAALVFAIAWTIGGRAARTISGRAAGIMGGRAAAPMGGRAAGGTFGGGAAAWLAGLTMALAPLQVGFGQEARSYTLMMALILLALWGLIGLAQAPETVGRRLGDRSAPRAAWAAYLLGTLGALWVLGDALPWLIAANIAMGVAILPHLTAKRRFLANWGVIQAAILLGAAPGYVAMLAAVSDHVMRSFGWIPPLSVPAAWADAASLYGLRDATMVTMRLLPTPFGALAPIMFGLACLGVWRLRHETGPILVLAIAFVGLPATLALMSLIHPVLLPRYLLWSAAPFFILAGFGAGYAIEAFSAPVQAGLVVLACLLLVVNLVPYYRAETKPRWDVAAAVLDSRIAPGDALLVSDGAAPFMLDFELRMIDPHHPQWPSTRNFHKAAKVLAGGHRVFAVYGPAGQGKEPKRRRFFAKVASLGGTAAPIRAGSEITIEQIDPGAPRIVACAGVACEGEKARGSAPGPR